MITKEQHGSCSKDTGNKECDGATKSDSDKMNGFDPGGKENSPQQNIATHSNGQTEDQTPLKIHSEPTSRNNKDHKGEKMKHEANEGIELSMIPESETESRTKSENTQSLVNQLPTNSSVIQIDRENSQQKTSDFSIKTVEWHKDGNGATPSLGVQDTVKNPSTDGTLVSVQTAKTTSATSNLNGGSFFSRLPLLFERATPSYFTPRFDSRVLEEQYWKSTFPRTTRRFQLGLIYLLFLTIALSIYFPAGQRPTWPVFLGLTLGTVSIVAGMLGNLI